jgi:hypothetical protein
VATLDPLRAGLVIGGLVVAAVAVNRLVDHNHSNLLDSIFPEREPLSPPPRRPDILDDWPTTSKLRPAPAPLPETGPIKDRPAHITWRWCYRFRWRTLPDEQRRLVPSGASRSQYRRIGALISSTWGEQLDASGVSFEVLRWIAAPQDPIERQQRFERVKGGEKPIELTKSCRPRREQLASSAARPVVQGDAATRGKACAVAEVRVASCPWTRRRMTCPHRAPTSPRWKPKTSIPCGLAMHEVRPLSPEGFVNVEAFFQRHNVPAAMIAEMRKEALAQPPPLPCVGTSYREPKPCPPPPPGPSPRAIRHAKRRAERRAEQRRRKTFDAMLAQMRADAVRRTIAAARKASSTGENSPAPPAPGEPPSR